VKISIIGIGKLGLAMALSTEAKGFEVTGCDLNEDYIKSINNKTLNSYEPQVNELLGKSESFKAVTSLEETLEFSDMIFVLVATPSLPSGEYDHSSVDEVVEKIAKYKNPDRKKYLVVSCTVMPKYTDTIAKKLKGLNYEVLYNPEFIAQGTIIKNQYNPDMVLIGCESEEAKEMMKSLYTKWCDKIPSFHFMSRTEAEICKIALNCIITTKITFANMVGEILLDSGYNPDKVLDAIGSDSRIGNKCLKYGFGFGGPCFPRDNKALYMYANSIGIDAIISKACERNNAEHLNYMIKREIAENKSKKIIMDCITYKKDSILLDESQQLGFAIALAKNGFEVVVKERKVVIDKLKEIYGDLFKYGIR
jgi:nucleotide sugar dehydrogenase